MNRSLRRARPSALRLSLPVVGLLSLAACGSKTTQEAAPSGDPNTVVVDAKGVFLAGVRVGDTPPDTRAKVGPLYDKLKEKREAAPLPAAEEYQRALTVDLDASVTCNAALSTYQTAAFAGYPNLTLKQGGVAATIKASVPTSAFLGVPDSNPGIPEMTLLFLPDGNVEIRRVRCGGAYDIVPAAAVAETVKQWCGANGDCVRLVRVGCSPAMPFAKVLPSLEALAKGAARMEMGLAGDCQPDEGPSNDVAEARRMALAKSILEPTAEPNAAPPPPPAGAPKKPVKAEVREGALVVTGALGEPEAKEALKATLPAVTACYEKGLATNPGLTGRIMPRLEIGRKGAVMRVSNGASDIPDESVIRCVLKAVGTATFPGKGSMVLVTYPLMFTPK